MRVGLVRSFHSGRVALAFRKATGGSDGGASTPRKSSGEYRWFEKAAPYSQFNEKAPEVTNEQIEFAVATPDLLETATPGQLLRWPSEIQAQLHHLGSYKPSQQNELFRNPISVVRAETLELWRSFVSQDSAVKSTIITGDPGVGKTSLLTQAHAAAKMKGWGVIHISQADKLLDGTSDAVLDPASGLWNQPMFVSRLLKKTLKSNRDLLGDKAKSANVKTLESLVQLFEGNVLVTVDNINALNQRVYAANTNDKNEKLYHNDLEVVNTILKWMGASPKNAKVVAATSGYFKPIDWKGYAYAKITDFDPELVNKLSAGEILELGRLSKPESEAYANFLHAADVTTKSWQELYQTGNGNPRAMLATAINYAY